MSINDRSMAEFLAKLHRTQFTQFPTFISISAKIGLRGAHVQTRPHVSTNKTEFTKVWPPISTML